MRKFLVPICALFALFAGPIWSQQVKVVENVTIINDLNTLGRMGQSTSAPTPTQATVCSNDTLAYALNKSTNLRVINMNGSTSAGAFGQFYENPEALTVSGLRFYAYKMTDLGGFSSNVVVELYNARPDSLPMGAPLRTATVVVDTNFYGGSLASLEKVAVFATPVVVTGAYVVVVRNSSPNPIGLIINDFATLNGGNEWLSTAQISGIWRRPYVIQVSGLPFNCDVLLDPIVTYTLSANFTANPGCISSAGNVSFNNASSPILKSRMYNVAAFLGRTGRGIVWNFGDGSPSCRQHTQIDTTHYYSAAGSYNVWLSDTLYGWSRKCYADTLITLGQAPQALFSQSSTSLTVNFVDQSSIGVTSWYWNFGDGTYSTLQNPTHTYASAGTYQVCQSSTSPCGTDTYCSPVAVTCPAPTAAFSSSRNDLTVDFVDWSTGNVTAWSWNFGDNVTSNLQNPSHTYMVAGSYLVCLKAYNACGFDSSWFWINVTCPAPVAAFSNTVNGLTADFDDLSSATNYALHWDFGDGTTAGGPGSQSHTYAQPGFYTVCLIVSSPCGIDTTCQVLNVAMTGTTPAIAGLDFQAFPNPVAGMLMVQAQLEAEENTTVSILDLRGAVLQKFELGMVQNADLRIDMSHLATGTYLVRLATTTAQVTKRINVLR